VCHTAESAIDFVRANEFNLVLLDIGLPDASGLEVLQQIRALRSDTAVIMFSGIDLMDTAISALRLGARDFLRKPCDPAMLEQMVDRALGEVEKNKKLRWTAEQLERSERLHRFLVEHSPDLVYILDAEGRFSYLSNAVRQFVGCDREALLGHSYEEIIDPADRAVANGAVNERRSGEHTSKNCELKLMRRGSADAAAPPIVSVSAIGLYERIDSQTPGQLFVGTYGVMRDITHLKNAQADLAKRAFYDELTGLPNRSLMFERLNLALAHARRARLSVSVLFLDLDGFKSVNDSFGHAAGDALLCALGDRMRPVLRADDTLARYAGDEFTVLLMDADLPKAQVVATKLIAILRAPFASNGLMFKVSASIGLAVFPDHAIASVDLIAQADRAMYAAKARGGDQMCVAGSGD
jgi:diguanylate cyclase (GGDEF)-like protein/PAS domain S-box-containing protein